MRDFGKEDPSYTAMGRLKDGSMGIALPYCHMPPESACALQSCFWVQECTGRSCKRAVWWLEARGTWRTPMLLGTSTTGTVQPDATRYGLAMTVCSRVHARQSPAWTNGVGRRDECYVGKVLSRMNLNEVRCG